MNLRTFLLGFLALALIGGAGAVAMYYQSLVVERAEKQKVADEYYFKDLCSNFGCSFEYPGEGFFERAEEVKEQMHKDGYSYAEIGIMADKAYKKARADHWADLREKRQALKSDGNS